MRTQSSLVYRSASYHCIQLIRILQTHMQQLNLAPGETSGDYIGCFLFGIEGVEGEQPSYHSLATNFNELNEDCRAFFHQLLVNRQQQMRAKLDALPPAMADLIPAAVRAKHEKEIRVISGMRDNVESYTRLHIEQNTSVPFIEVCGMRIFLRLGARKRARRGDQYLE